MTMSAADREQRDRDRMQRKKAVVAAAIDRADQDQGLLLVLTGNGKGKSSSAFAWLEAGSLVGCPLGLLHGKSSCLETSDQPTIVSPPLTLRTWPVT